MKVYYDKLNNYLEQTSSSLFMIYGSPVCLAIDAKASIEKKYQGNGYNIEKHFADSSFDHKNILNTLNNLGLFQQKRLIEIHLLDTKMPASVAAFITDLIQLNLQDTICVIIATEMKFSDIPKNILKLIDSNGTLVPIYDLKEWQFSSWMNNQIKKINLNVSRNIANIIVEKINGSVEIGNQILTKLALEYGNQEISIKNIENVLDDSSQTNVFEMFSLAFLGEYKNAIASFQTLKQSNIDINIILWQTSYELHNLTNLAKKKLSGMNIAELASQVPVYKKEAYISALTRLSYQKLTSLILRVPFIDKQAKGLAPGDPWLEIEQILLCLCAKQNLPAFLHIKSTH